LNNCAFTVCAKNYLGLAKILEKSIKKYTESIDFFIIIADEFSFADRPTESNVFIAKELLSFNEDEWNKLTFKYDITEFCTCIKPFVFSYFFNEKKYEKICYLDPDILFFDSPQIIYDELESCEILLTPHNLFYEINENKNILEDEIRQGGLFNFGFLGLKNGIHSNNFLEWWGNRLIKKCFYDIGRNLFTDQKWGDFLTVYFSYPVLKISRYLGWNVAPWNFEEREIILENEKYFVVNRKKKEYEKDSLIFMHFSGYNYMELINTGNLQQKQKSHDIFYSDYKCIFDIFINLLKENISIFELYSNMKYSYNFYDNGKQINLIERRVFNKLIINEIGIGNPFNSSNIFYKRLRNNNLFCQNKLLERDINKIEKKNKIFYKIFEMIYKIIGFKKYNKLLGCFKIILNEESLLYILNYTNKKKLKN